jgi:chromate transport protein ChrA
MGLDVIVVVVLFGLTIHGYRQGFLKGAGSLLTPIVALWLSLRYSGRLSYCFSAATGDHTSALVLAIIAILVVSYLGIRLMRNIFSRLLDRFRIWDMDQFMGGALGLVKATMIIWIVIAFAYIAYPEGRRAISRAPLSAQILMFGEDVPALRQKLNQANRYVKGITNPLQRYQMPELTGDPNNRANAEVMKGLNLEQE